MPSRLQRRRTVLTGGGGWFAVQRGGGDSARLRCERGRGEEEDEGRGWSVGLGPIDGGDEAVRL
jgi:hypothetical protein